MMYPLYEKLYVASFQALSIMFIEVQLIPLTSLVQIKEAPYTRLCSTKNILTVNGLFLGPTVHIREGDTTVIRVHNKGTQNITIHWYIPSQKFFFFPQGSSLKCITIFLLYIIKKIYIQAWSETADVSMVRWSRVHNSVPHHAWKILQPKDQAF